ncbi:YncE family protein [Mycobacterium sp. Aquia_216]|uniref:YncE family protein n=1 Tax=Mycobacterium sp. Aquia_216 TaxID=2991729 RepID=UPI00227B8910|nr:YncE family protein [Mycobacterium sp. Aquia_216]WAJ44173.1 YncE family protein [Mycobacterium sp. Aquia_216]
MSELNGREAAREIVEVDATPIAPVAVEIAVGNGPISGIAISRDGSRLLATNYGADSVSVIDTDTFRVVETIEGVDEPFAIAISGGRAYVSTVSAAYDSIQVIDTDTHGVVATHPVALSVSDLAVDSAGRHVYASRNAAGIADVAVLDTVTGRVQAIDVGAAAAPGTATECVRVSTDGSRVYVGVNGPAGGRVVVIGTKAPADVAGGRASWRKKRTAVQQTAMRVIDTVEIGLPIRDVALSHNGAIAYVASCAPEVGVVVDLIDTRTNKITHTRKVGEIGGVLTGMTLSADGDRVYLVSDDSVTVLCTLTHDVIATLGAGMQPSCVVESPDGTRLYVGGYSGAVSVTPIASASPLAIEAAAADSELSTAGWLLADLVPHEPVLA